MRENDLVTWKFHFVLRRNEKKISSVTFNDQRNSSYDGNKYRNGKYRRFPRETRAHYRLWFEVFFCEYMKEF